MTDQSFDHDRLDVYRLSIDYVARSCEASQSLERLHRHARDPWFRAAQSIPLNIAAGNGKRGLKNRARIPAIACGSAEEGAAIQGVLVTSKGINVLDDAGMKAMLTRLAIKLAGGSIGTQGRVLASITSTATLNTSTIPWTRQNHGIQRSGGGEASSEPSMR